MEIGIALWFPCVLWNCIRYWLGEHYFAQTVYPQKIMTSPFKECDCLIVKWSFCTRPDQQYFYSFNSFNILNYFCQKEDISVRYVHLKSRYLRLNSILKNPTEEQFRVQLSNLRFSSPSLELGKPNQIFFKP